MRHTPDSQYDAAGKAGKQVLDLEGVENATFTPDTLVVKTLPDVDTKEIKWQVEGLLDDLAPDYTGMVVIETDDDLIR
ncbi:MAG: hypothetical protein QF741_02835 [Candidatus Peribacteraceae bacterium]|jgi:hypothetical protein|nr:hypothetical protein [Candidatus Peribacteraceae bacterium]MDP7646061.1 hypothetical protein [Candidatus Peribacteraceae bacterium]|tara:strand:- start:18 stop:251 length:234 start_codon:yes stop_codon:yes gene_type:complete